MKKQKAIESVWLAKTLAVVLAVLVVVAMYMLPASAAELTADGSGASTVAHTVSAEFTAGIPAYVMPDETGEKTAKYTVTLENAVIPDNHELTAKVEYSGSMTEQNGVELPYELFDETGNAIVSGAKVLSKAAGMPDDSVSVSFGAALTAKARYSGVYTDTATFTFDVAEKFYTLDEINADEHIYAIGKTKPEYVVAEFNEDYSAVTIFKNGNNSDGEMQEWSYIGRTSPFYKRKTLKEATINVGVTNIGSFAFYGYNLTSLESIAIPNSVTSIGESAFEGCYSLTNVIIPDSVISIGKSAFSNCRLVESVTIGNGAKTIGEKAFYWCQSLKNIVIPDSVTSIDDASFAGCTSLESAVIGSGVAVIGGEGVFAGCTALENVTIRNGVKTIGMDCFEGCTSLTNIEIPDSVTSIYVFAFKDCTSLENVKIGNGVTVIGMRAFEGCTSLTNIEIPDSVTEINTFAFNRCTSLQNIIVGAGNKVYYDIDGVLFNKSQSGLVCCPAGRSDYTIPNGVRRIESSAFSSCNSITNIIVPDSVYYIGIEAFKDCTLLDSITIPDSVTRIESSAFNNSGLQTIYGTAGSYAETFAAQNGYTFIAQ